GYNAAATGSITYNVVSGSGKYEIEIVNITDKITEKSFGALAANDPARNATSTDLPAAPYTFYSLPTPTTSKIQHITNL
ncbi:MAG TPA: hypothetical protein VHO72_11520, partial [Bacteroidales bacterium]|nr:hypothetical protein [Bacteroidales bacterium]